MDKGTIELKERGLKVINLNEYLRPEVRAYAVAMEDELRENDYKGPGGWKHYSLELLFSKLLGELSELYEAMVKWQHSPNKTHYRDEMASEAADVGNFAMMIHDLITREEKPTDGKA